MLKILYSHKVKQDLKSISDFIAQDSPIYSIKTVQSIQKTIALLSEFPYIGKTIDGSIREVIETKYRYKIVYEVSKIAVTILSVYKYQNTWE
ncbi:MAG: type II toxin-antitoxin system RelE/ParE family toxin [Candidatus Gracilibacteria bacterium]|nr:type II toxin-antitoxin system RelE/ParE family toxin [Candidatus Gracilibacteria bacterium]